MKLVWTDGAFETLREARDYLTTAASEEFARRTIQEIYAKTQLLRDHPRLGYRHDEKRGVERRILLFGHYRILYGVETDRVTIFGIFHAARDVDLSES